MSGEFIMGRAANIFYNFRIGSGKIIFYKFEGGLQNLSPHSMGTMKIVTITKHFNPPNIIVTTSLLCYLERELLIALLSSHT